ncbi:hypothetical protein MESS2_440036 [Mesorhizobium metallidurans STM 2683]|uniref:Uncharacterized protein n=1 Tax=Mesorhizobium metallidurans STM 2683 TaxID=1297569 RepID=M5F4Y1_9HYPH|nr:hypothetical protein MESS2_440036 [Mesorhizobium metallidurans STM 2683]
MVIDPASMCPSLRRLAQREKVASKLPTRSVGDGMLPKIETIYLEWQAGSYHIARYNEAVRGHGKRIVWT